MRFEEDADELNKLGFHITNDRRRDLLTYNPKFLLDVLDYFENKYEPSSSVEALQLEEKIIAEQNKRVYNGKDFSLIFILELLNQQVESNKIYKIKK